MTREEMMERMSQEEFLGWLAYSELEPFGEAREDLRAGILWSLLATVNSDRKKVPNGIGIEQYPLLQMMRRLETPPVTSESLFRVMKMLADATAKKGKPS